MRGTHAGGNNYSLIESISGIARESNLSVRARVYARVRVCDDTPNSKKITLIQQSGWVAGRRNVSVSAGQSAELKIQRKAHGHTRRAKKVQIYVSKSKHTHAHILDG